MGDIREELEAAFESAETQSSTEAPEASPVADGTPAPETGETTTTAAPVTETAAQARARDEAGRFASKAKAPAAVTAKVLTPPSVTAPPATGEATQTETPKAGEAASTAPRAPQSWKPAAREKWGALPPETQAEVVRREAEITKAMQEAAPARRLADAFQETLRPYMPMIQAEGGDALKAVGSLLQTAAALRTAPPRQKAQLVAQLVRTYGIDIGDLDSELSGQAAPQRQQAPYQDPRVDALIYAQQQAQRHAQQAVQAKAVQDIEAAKAEMDFLDDVREDMADLIEVAQRRGVALSLKDAYSRAVAMNPEISGILKQREASKAAETANAATQRAKSASSSVRSSQAPVNTQEGPSGDRRSYLEAAWSAHSGRR